MGAVEMRVFKVVLVVVLAAPFANAQMVTTEVGNTNVNNGFSEQFGIGWSLRGNGFFFNQPGPPLLPPFGPQINPSQFGISGPNGSLSIFGGQSSSRSITSQSASVTTMDGMPGSITSQQLTPFVTGITPVVGSGFDPVAAATQRTLQRISESQAARKNSQLRTYLRRAERASESGNLRMARANYRMAYGLADANLQVLIERQAASLRPAD